MLESQFSYQTSIEESVCLVFDTAKTATGFLSVKVSRFASSGFLLPGFVSVIIWICFYISFQAYRMTKEAIKMFKEGDFTPDAIKDLHISYETMFTQVPIVVKNSHLMNALMLEMQVS